MDQCPQELLDQIYSHLNEYDLATASYVSTKFHKVAKENVNKFRTRYLWLDHEPDLAKPELQCSFIHNVGLVTAQ